MNYSLPKYLTVGGAEYDIRYDFRVTLDIIEALEDPELSSQEKAFVSVKIFYPDYERIPEVYTGECFCLPTWKSVTACFLRLCGGVTSGLGGKKLDKAEAEWYRRNRHLVDFRQAFTDAEDTVLSSWGAK